MKTKAVIKSIGALSKKWLRKDYSFRRRAIARLEKRSGFSRAMAGAMLDALFSELTEAALWRLLRSEMRDPGALDGFVKDGDRLVRARGPRTALHVLPANVPNAAVVSLATGLLLQSRNILKVSSRDEGVLPLYLDSLKVHDRALWNLCSLVYGRAAARLSAKDADLVVAYGDDGTLRKMRAPLPVKTAFVGYGHRVSFALILKESLDDKTAKRTAHDVWMADQRGCLSPVIVFAQKGGKLAADAFAEKIARYLRALETGESSKPRRSLLDGLARRRFLDRVKIEALKGGRGSAWQSASGTWMVVYDERKDAEFSAGSQVIRVKGFSKLSELEPIFEGLRGSLQAVSLECAASYRKKIAEWLGVFGVNRICRAGQMQKPPIAWHHDGRFNLAYWLSWTDLEK